MVTIEIIATLLGFAQGILAMLNKRINWIVYAVQMVFLIIFSFYSHLYGDAVQNVVYFFFCIYSYYLWKSEDFAKITMLSWRARIFVTAIIAVSTFILGAMLETTDDPLPYVDSFTTMTTVIAFVLMMQHRVEAWIVWLFNDIAYMYQYFNLPDQALYLFGLYIVWTILAVLSFINWYRLYKKTL